MARTLIATAVSALALAALSSSPALAQQRITVGQTVQGTLTTSDPALSDGSHYDCWLFDAPGGALTITVESSAFDTVLMASPGAACGDGDENTVRQNDDGPGMGTNSQVSFSNARGPHWLVVNSYGAGQTGAYTLRVAGGAAPAPSGQAKPPSGGGQAAPAASAAITSLTVGGADGGGDLTTSSPALSNGRLYACYVVDARSGPVTIDVMSGFIDVYADVGTGRDCGDSMRVLASDDDSGDNTNARISGTFNEQRLLIRATTYGPGVTGRHFVRVRPGLPEARPVQGSMDALPTVVSEWSTEADICAAAYGAMEDVLDSVRRYGNVGVIDYAARERQTRARARSTVSIDFIAGNFVLIALGGFIDNRPEQVSEYLTTVANCDRAFGFTPVTRFN